MPSLFLLLFLGFSTLDPAIAADPRFEDHPAIAVLETCAPLDFMSTSLSRNHQERIQQGKPGTSKPNFGGRYLLLNLSLMMENLWLIADCSSGKFMKPTLDGKARFEPDSMLVELRTQTGTEWQVWRDGGWVRIETAIRPASTPLPRSDGLTLPGNRSIAPCTSPDYRTFFKADEVRNNLIALNPEPGQVNFAGHYRILKNELLFDTRWFLLDCRTGKFEKEVLSADRAEFTAGTETLTLTDEGKFPRRLKWTRSQWIETPDPGRPDQTVRNVLEGPDARKLFGMLPNPAQHDRLEFERFVCEQVGNAPASVCSIRMVSTGSSKEPHVFGAGESSWISGLVADFGGALLSPRSDTRIIGIHSGFCLKEKSRCEFESGTGKVKP